MDEPEKRGMNPEQVREWRQNPDTFKMPDGGAPKPLAPNHKINQNHMRQVQEAKQKTQPGNQ